MGYWPARCVKCVAEAGAGKGNAGREDRPAPLAALGAAQENYFQTALYSCTTVHWLSGLNSVIAPAMSALFSPRLH
jgi:hypothetical protein